jgi:hypothetical protein
LLAEFPAFILAGEIFISSFYLEGVANKVLVLKLI